MQDKNRTKNPATGKFHSDFEMMAERAKLNASTMGSSELDKSVIEVQLRVEEDTPAVQQYVLPMVHLLRDFTGPAGELRQVIPELLGLKTVAKDDGTLTTAERRRIGEYADKLVTFVNQKTTIFNRIASKMTGVAKDKREALSDNLKGSRSIIAKGLGHLISPRKESQIGKDAASARADLLGQRVEATHSALDAENAKFDAKHPEIAPDVVPDVTPAKSKRKGKAVGADALSAGAGPSEGGGQVLKDILVVNKGISDRIDNIIGLMRGEQDQAAKNREMSEIQGQQAADVEPVGEHVVKDKKKSGGSLIGGAIGGAFDWMKSMFGEGGLSTVMKTLTPALKALSAGAAIAAAGFVGWKIGSYAAKWMGLGDSTDALKKLIDNTAQSYTDSLKSMGHGVVEKAKSLLHIGQTEEQKAADDVFKNQAFRRGGHAAHARPEDFTVEEAKQWLVDHPETPKVDAPPAPAMLPGATAVARDDFGINAPNTAAGANVSMSGPSDFGINAPNTAAGANVSMAGPSDFSINAPSALGAGAAVSMSRPVGKAVAKPDASSALANLHVSEKGIAALKGREGIQKTPYWDVNGWAIGFGDHTYHGVPLGSDPDPKNKPKVELTDAEADTMLRERLRSHYEPIIKKQLTGPIGQEQFDALVSVAWNTEVGGRNLAKRVNRGETLKESDFLASATVKGVPEPNLQKRRHQEYAQFMSSPAPTRAAGPVEALSAANKSNVNVNVHAPTTIAQNGGDGGTVPVIIQRIQPRTTDEVMKGVSAVNNV